jgi:hypothetical protein
MHMVADRVHSEPLSSQIFTQPDREWRERPIHHNPSTVADSIIRAHDLLLSVDRPIDQTHGRFKIMSVAWVVGCGLATVVCRAA